MRTVGHVPYRSSVNKQAETMKRAKCSFSVQRKQNKTHPNQHIDILLRAPLPSVPVFYCPAGQNQAENFACREVGERRLLTSEKCVNTTQKEAAENSSTVLQ